MKRKAPSRSRKATASADSGVAFLHPRLSTTLVGHRAFLSLFTQSFDSGRMPHAWLLTGPRGIGKATAAYHLSRAVLASRGSSSLSLAVPPEHPTFQRLAKESHTDFLAITPDPEKTSGEIGVETMRSIQPFLRMTAAETPYRIVLVDCLDALSTEASNALLKLLEEPPAHALFFLIAHRLGTALRTIQSRCHVMRMLPLDWEETERTLALTPALDVPSVMKGFDFAPGQPGVLQLLHREQILALYAQIVSLWQEGTLSMAALHRLAERAATFKTMEAWESFTLAIDQYFARLIRFHSGLLSMQTLSSLEESVFPRVCEQFDLESLYEIWEKARLLFADTRRIYLDSYTAVIAAFEPFATQPSPLTL